VGRSNGPVAAAPSAIRLPSNLAMPEGWHKQPPPSGLKRSQQQRDRQGTSTSGSLSEKQIKSSCIPSATPCSPNSRTRAFRHLLQQLRLTLKLRRKTRTVQGPERGGTELPQARGGVYGQRRLEPRLPRARVVAPPVQEDRPTVRRLRAEQRPDVHCTQGTRIGILMPE